MKTQDWAETRRTPFSEDDLLHIIDRALRLAVDDYDRNGGRYTAHGVALRGLSSAALIVHQTRYSDHAGHETERIGIRKETP